MNSAFMTRERCCLCQSDDHSVLGQWSFSEERVANFLNDYYQDRVPPELLDDEWLRYVQCSQCGFVWQHRVLDESWLGELYEHWISPQESLAKKELADAKLYRMYADEMIAISQIVAKQPSDVAVMDFGMGWGYWARMAQGFGFDVTGCELSQRRIDHARELGIKKVSRLENCVDHGFDFINAEQVFEHLVDPYGLLSVLVEKLSDGGVIRIAVPRSDTAIAKLKAGKWKPNNDSLHPLEHVNAFTSKTLKRLATSQGLVQVRRPVSYLRECRGMGQPYLMRVFFSALGVYDRSGTALYFARRC